MTATRRNARVLLAAALAAGLAACGGPDRIRSFPTYAVGAAQITAVGGQEYGPTETIVTRADRTRGLLPTPGQPRPQLVQVSPTGVHVVQEREPARGAARGRATVLDLRTGREQTLVEPAPCVRTRCTYDFLFSPDASVVAWYVATRGVAVFRSADGRWEVVRRYPPEYGRSLLAVADDGTLLTYLNGATELRLEDPGGRRRPLRVPGVGVFTRARQLHAAFLPDRAKLLVTVGRDVFLLDLRSGRAWTTPPERLLGDDDTHLSGAPYLAGASAAQVLIAYGPDYGRTDFATIDLGTFAVRTLGTVESDWLYQIRVSTSRMRAGVSIADLRRAASLNDTRD